LVETTELIRSRATTCEPAAVDTSAADRVRVRWGDGHESVYPRQWLTESGRSPRDNPDLMAAERAERVLWDAPGLEKLGTPVVTRDDFISEGGIRRAMHLVTRFGFVFVSGVERTREATRELLRRVARPRRSAYGGKGGVWQFSADLYKSDTAYTTLGLGSHTDGTYFRDPPGMQCFQLLEHASGSGGEFTMKDGFLAVRNLAESHPESVDYLLRQEVPWHHIIDDDYLFARRPVLKLHAHAPAGARGRDAAAHLEMISLNNNDRAPMHFASPAAAEEFYVHYGRLLESIEQLAQWESRVPAGHVLLVNNWRVMHGRNAFTGRRTVCGLYFNAEDWESHLSMEMREKQLGEWKLP
jgi:trimethyllysine dioxygenase